MPGPHLVFLAEPPLPEEDAELLELELHRLVTNRPFPHIEWVRTDGGPTPIRARSCRPLRGGKGGCGLPTGLGYLPKEAV